MGFPAREFFNRQGPMGVLKSARSTTEWTAGLLPTSRTNILLLAAAGVAAFAGTLSVAALFNALLLLLIQELLLHFFNGGGLPPAAQPAAGPVTRSRAAASTSISAIR